jgi:hypothetical protein
VPRKGFLTILGQLALPTVQIALSDAQFSFNLGRAFSACLVQLQRLKLERSKCALGRRFVLKVGF